jgi:hypothetical protein
MKDFEFLIGEWNLEYKIPKSMLSEEATGRGTGKFSRFLNEKFVVFDYKASFSSGESAEAHGIFSWDEKIKMYRYFWFEDSGNFMTATCNFPDNEILFMNWHNSNLIQTFNKLDDKTVELRMENPGKDGKFQLVLEVILSRK